MIRRESGSYFHFLLGGWGRGLRTFSWRLSERIFVCSVPKNGSVRWSCISPRR